MAYEKIRHGFAAPVISLPTRIGPTSGLGGVLQMDRDAALGIAFGDCVCQKVCGFFFPCETAQTLVVTHVPCEHDSTIRSR